MKFIYFFIFSTLLYGSVYLQAGGLTNNGNSPINVVMYANYVAPTQTISAKGRLNKQGTVVPAGQNIDFISATTSIDIYYGNGTYAALHADINANFEYTISPGPNGWILTQDK